MRYCLPCVVACVLSACATTETPTQQEAGYYTWVDANGRVQHTPIIDPSATEVDFVEQVYNTPAPAPAPAPAPSSSIFSNSSNKIVPEAQTIPSGLKPSFVALLKGEISDEQLDAPLTSQSLPAKASGQDGEYFTWVDSQGVVHNSPLGPSTTQGVEDEYQDYVPAELLEAQGFKRPDQGEAYYTWVDEQGRVHSDFIPADQTVTLSSQPQAPIEVKVPLVYSAVDELALSSNDLLPYAAPYLPQYQRVVQQREQAQSWLLSCRDVTVADEVSELQFEIKQNVILDSFSTRAALPVGNAYYQMYALPAGEGDYGVRLRSFIKTGALYPGVIFLDKQGQPTRVVRHILDRYQPESNARYGFFEGVIKVDSRQYQEAYMLVFAEQRLNAKQLNLLSPMPAALLQGELELTIKKP